jgi:transposase
VGDGGFLVYRTDVRYIAHNLRLLSNNHMGLYPNIGKISMIKLITAGIDISQDWIDVHIHPEGHNRRISNDAAGMLQLVSWLQSYAPEKVVCEATGGLERLTVKTLRDVGMKCYAVNPARINGFRQATGKLAKTDILDAEVIALFAARMDIEEREPLSVTAQKLKDHAARRRQLVEMQVQERNRLKRCHDTDGKKSINKVLALLEKERQNLEEKMLNLVRKDQELGHKMDILTSIPGIGDIVALTLVSDMPELGKINDKQAASLAGLAPQDRQSGLRARKASIRGGRKCVRTAMYMAAMSAKKYNPAIRPFYERLVQNGKPKMVALTAAMRKLLIQANQLLTEDRKWKESMAA